MSKIRLVILLSLIFVLNVAALQPVFAQDGGETPVAIREAAINAHKSLVPDATGRPTSWRHAIIGQQTTSSLGCSLVTGSDLATPVAVYQVWLTYGEEEYLYHVSEDGVLVQPCDSKLPEASLTVTPPLQQSACPGDFAGYLRPRLNLNGQGRVIAGGVPNRVRNQPSTNSNMLFQMEPGTAFNAVSGPKCSDGIVWWMIQTEAGSGWTAESNFNDSKSYYLEPSGSLSNIVLSSENVATATRINSNFEFVLNFTMDAAGQLLLNGYNSLDLYHWDTLNTDVDPIMLVAPGSSYFDASSSGQYLASASYTQSGADINFWDTTNGTDWTPDQVFHKTSDQGMMGFAVSNNGVVAIAHGVFGFPEITPGPVTLWDGKTNMEMVSLQHRALVTDLAFSPDGTRLVTSTLGEGTFIWSVPDGNLLTTLAVSGIPAFSPDGAMLAIGGMDGTVSFWQTSDFMNAGNIPAFEPFDVWSSAVTAIDYSADGSLLVVGRGIRYVDGGPPEGFTADIKVIDTQTNTVIATFVGDQNYVNDVAFSPDGTTIIVNEIGSIYFLNVQP